MPLEIILNDEIRRAIFLYREICKDPTNLDNVDAKYLGEHKKMEFVTEFIRAGGAKEREKRARLEKEAYEKIKRHFAEYVGMKLFEKLNLAVDIPSEARILLGNFVIDANYNNV